MDFPSNSISARTAEKAPDQEPAETQTPSEPTRAKKVVTGKVSEKKKTLGKRFKEMFLHDGGNFAEHIAEKVIVPMVKDMALSIATQMVDGFRQGVEEMLFGPDGKGDRRRTSSYDQNRPRINYSRISSSTRVSRSEDRPSRNDRDRRSNRVKEIIVETRDEGDAVLEELEAIIDSEVGHCTVGDFYAACGESTVSTDEDWGWTDLRSARVVDCDPRSRNSQEFLIVMPRPRALDK